MNIKHLWKRIKQWFCDVGLCNLDKCKCRYSGRSAAWNERKTEIKSEPIKIRPTVIPKDMVECKGNRLGSRTLIECGKMINMNTRQCPHCGTLRKTII